MAFAHKSVLFEETMQMLNVHPGGIYLDGTLGGGGHSYGILERSEPDGRLIGIDRDGKALAAAQFCRYGAIDRSGSLRKTGRRAA